MHHTFAVYGASDDLVVQELDGKGYDETSPPTSFMFVAGTKTLHARVSFDGKKGSGWKVSTELQDDTEKGDLPFMVTVVQHNYSPKLVVQAVDGPVNVFARSKKIATLHPSVASVEVDASKRPQGDSSWDGDCG